MKLIFTDLDGTLLDHHTYSFQEAKESLDYLKQNNIPIIINTSKTKAEVIDLRKELGVEDSPFIVENGGGVFFPEHFKFDNLKMVDNYYLLKIGKSYSEILEFFDSVRGRYSIKGFHQMSIEDVVKHTG
ncbi:MAG: HAD-IIB family hydrolase, partial [Campylobacterales bacterium]|nr:HAD-IIB family hydrolase [Campylobacterales bacterium]